MDASIADWPQIADTTSYEDQDQRIADAIRSVAARAGGSIRILEAGCGNRWPLNLGAIPYHLTGVDLDAAALEIRKNVHKDLDESIHGDLCKVALPAASYDVVYSAYVLEHIKDADQALENMLSALKPNGLMILRIPDPDTAKGFVTQVTPFWFHVLYHRWVMKRPNAGKPGYAPYPTHYHPVISKSGIRKYARDRNLACRGLYADSFAREGEGLAGIVFRTGARVLDGLSAGRFTSRYSDLIYLLEKR